MDGGTFAGGHVLHEYKNIAKGVKDAKILKGERVQVNGADVDCWVVSLDYLPSGSETSASAQAAGLPAIGDFARSKMLWVDKNSCFVYQHDSTTKMTMPNTNAPTNMKVTSKVETFTEPVAPDAFTFTAPPGAKEIDESKFMKPKIFPKQPSQEE